MTAHHWLAAQPIHTSLLHTLITQPSPLALSKACSFVFVSLISAEQLTETSLPERKAVWNTVLIPVCVINALDSDVTLHQDTSKTALRTALVYSMTTHTTQQAATLENQRQVKHTYGMVLFHVCFNCTHHVMLCGSVDIPQCSA